jgi:hypothetical protein
MNKYLKTGLIWAFILALILIPTYCGLNQFRARKTVENPISDNSSQTKKENRYNFIFDSVLNANKILAVKNDSILKLKQKTLKGRDRKKDSLVYVSDSNCVKSLNILYFECQKVDSVNNSLLTVKNERIKNDSIFIVAHEGKTAEKQKRINRDSTYIEHLHRDSIPQVKRKGFVKGFLIGFGSGAAAKEGVDILTKIKP